jgi:hypothetical protein
VNEGSFRFFNDFSKVSCEFVTKGSNVICSDKKPEKIKSKDQNFDKIVEKIEDI